MRCPRLSELPPPPTGKAGWPWTQESERVTSVRSDGKKWPRMTVVTPSFNQGKYIEETIRSVLLQGYPDIEFFILDGGSADETLSVIKKYERFLSGWRSERDDGQAASVQEGFKRSSGDLVAWQNSDDFYGKDSFSKIAEVYHRQADSTIIHGQVYKITEEEQKIEKWPVQAFSKENYHLSSFANQQAMFFKKEILEEGHYPDPSYQHILDYEFIWRLVLAGYRSVFVPEATGYFHVHAECKTVRQEAVRCAESFEMGKQLLVREDVPVAVKRQLEEAMYADCVIGCASEQAADFRRRTWELINLTSGRCLKPFLVKRWIKSWIISGLNNRI